MRRRNADVYRLMPVGVLVCVLLVAAFVLRPEPAHIVVSSNTSELPADGNSVATIIVRAVPGRRLDKVDARIASGIHSASISAAHSVDDAIEFAVRSRTMPGPVVVEVNARGAAPAAVVLNTTLDVSDTYADGTPDFLRLEDPSDQAAFREWFTFLAEHEAFRPTQQLPAEINDCAALIRYAYRESLRDHDGSWAAGLRLREVPGTTSVQKYQFPYTALGASLFRVKAGTFSADDLQNGAFGQFADAHVLQSVNTHFVSRDLRRARPGDLLLFRQQDHRMPYHVMIFLGRSHFENRAPDSGLLVGSDFGNNLLVYHTGPAGEWKGEIRRVTVAQLMQHPDPSWRPWRNNRSFLGVYRWNILRDNND